MAAVPTSIARPAPTSLTRVRAIREVLAVLAAWGVGLDDQARLLGLPHPPKRRDWARYRRGEGLSDAAVFDERCAGLLRIAAATRAMYPLSEISANAWASTPNPYFNDHSPLQVILARGHDGLERILEHLDGEPVWRSQ